MQCQTTDAQNHAIFLYFLYDAGLYDKTQLITKYSTNFTKETNERQKPPYVYKTQSREHRFQR